jgi:CheY-like chemotaxis protein
MKPVAFDALMSALERTGAALRSVLIIDDNRDNTEMLSRMLSSVPEPPDILKAYSGREALALRRKSRMILLGSCCRIWIASRCWTICVRSPIGALYPVLLVSHIAAVFYRYQGHQADLFRLAVFPRSFSPARQHCLRIGLPA